MAIAFRAATTLAYGLRTNSTVTVPAGTTTGDVVVIAFDVGNTAAITPTGMSGWSMADVTYAAPGDPWYVHLIIYAKAWQSGESSYTITHSNGYSQASVTSWSGVDTGTIFDVTPSTAFQNQGVGGSGNATAPSITIANAGAQGITVRGSWDGNAITPPSTWSERYDSPVLWVGEKNYASAGATGTVVVAAGNGGNDSPWGIIHAALRPAGTGANTGTLSASTPLTAASVAGASVNAGTMAAAVPRATSGTSGQSVNSGTMSASVPRATSSISEQASVAGTLAATVPVATASVSGASVNTGTMNAQTPKAVSTISGTATLTGTLSAATPRVTSTISDTTTNPGTLAGSVPRATATIAGQGVNAGSLSVTVPALQAAAAGQSANSAALAAALPPVRATIAGVQLNPAALLAATTLVRFGVASPSVPALVAARTRTDPATATTRSPDNQVTVRTERPTIRTRTPAPLE